MKVIENIMHFNKQIEISKITLKNRKDVSFKFHDYLI